MSVNYVSLPDGLTSINYDNGTAGRLHIWVVDGKIKDITLYNAKITKKKTHTDNESHHVNLDIKTDW